MRRSQDLAQVPRFLQRVDPRLVSMFIKAIRDSAFVIANVGVRRKPQPEFIIGEFRSPNVTVDCRIMQLAEDGSATP